MASNIPDRIAYDPEMYLLISKQPGAPSGETPTRPPLQDITTGRPEGQPYYPGVTQYPAEIYGQHDYLRTHKPRIKIVFEDGSVRAVDLHNFKIMVQYRPLQRGVYEHLIRVDIVIANELLDYDVMKVLPLTVNNTAFGKEYHMTARIAAREIYIKTSSDTGGPENVHQLIGETINMSTPTYTPYLPSGPVPPSAPRIRRTRVALSERVEGGGTSLEPTPVNTPVYTEVYTPIGTTYTSLVPVVKTYSLWTDLVVTPKETPSMTYVFSIVLDPATLYLGIDSVSSKLAARGWLLPGGIKKLTLMR